MVLSLVDSGYCFSYYHVTAIFTLVGGLPGKACWYKFNPSIAHQCYCSSEDVFDFMWALRNQYGYHVDNKIADP